MPIHEKNLIKKGDLIQKEKAELEGIDVSGQWNTFIRPRVVPDYDTRILREIASTPMGSTITKCWQCGTCTAGCCMHTDFGLREFNPRYFIYLAQKGAEDELKQYSNVIWRCVTCNKCVERCPKGVRVEEVIHAIENYMHTKGMMDDTPARKWDKQFLENVLEAGVLDELMLVYKYIRQEKVQEFDTGYMMKFGLKLFRTGRVRTGPLRRKVKGWEKIRNVAAEILEKGGEKR